MPGDQAVNTIRNNIAKGRSYLQSRKSETLLQKLTARKGFNLKFFAGSKFSCRKYLVLWRLFFPVGKTWKVKTSISSLCQKSRCSICRQPTNKFEMTFPKNNLCNHPEIIFSDLHRYSAKKNMCALLLNLKTVNISGRRHIFKLTPKAFIEQSLL